MLHLAGRHTSLATRLAYVAQGDEDRADYEAADAESVSVQLNNGTHGLTIALNAQNILNPFEDELPLDDLYMQASTSVNQWDSTAGSDFTLTFA